MFDSQIPTRSAEFVAIWDTGATASVITQKVIDELGLATFGIATVNGVHGSNETTRHVVGITLPNGVSFAPVEVTCGVLGDFDVLIGMDIIATGSFAVTNLNGKTTMTFSHPSLKTIDFVAQYPAKKVVIPPQINNS